MIKYIFVLTLILLSNVSYAIDCKHPGSYIKESEIDYCSHQDYLDSNKKLNKVYLKILDKYKNYPAAYNNAVIAERAWVTFRNAQLAMKYPPLKANHYYGRIHKVIKDAYLEELTDQRTKQLKEILSDPYVDDLNE